MARIKGGKRLERFLREAKGARGVNRVEVGFFSTARYDDGTPVTNVAATQEFGDPDQNIPERPFFRIAIRTSEDDLINVLERSVDPMTMVVDRRTAGLMGETMKNHIQRSITELREPPNSPRTIKKKKSSNPLIDTGFMRMSVTYRVE